MVWRQQFGERNGVYGGWISKPGYDVTTAAPGEFLLDTNAQVFQCVLTGNTTILTAGGPVVPPGTYSASVGLPSEFAAFSNLYVSVVYYRVFNPAGTITVGGNENDYLVFNTVSGVLNLYSILVVSSGGYGGGNSMSFCARWSVFRAQF